MIKYQNRALESRKKNMDHKKYYEERPWLVPKPPPKRDIGKEILDDLPPQFFKKKRTPATQKQSIDLNILSKHIPKPPPKKSP